MAKSLVGGFQKIPKKRSNYQEESEKDFKKKQNKRINKSNKSYLDIEDSQSKSITYEEDEYDYEH